MKRFLLVLISVYSAHMAAGQSRDTLVQMLAVAKEDTNKVNLYNALSFRYAWSNADTSILYAEQAMELAQKLNMEIGLADARQNMCAALTTLGNYSRALDNAFKALVIYERLHDIVGVGFTNQLIAGCYRDLGDYSNSFNYFNKSLKLAEGNQKKKQEDNGYEPVVSLTTRKVDAGVEISVADNGNGMPQKVVDKIFQPFFTTKPTGSGTGLGLSLAYDIVKAHGGEIKVETKEGEGSDFIIHLPVV